MDMTVKILHNDHGTPPGKLADAEVHFTGGDLDGLKLVGFAGGTRRDGNGQNVTLPSRPFTVHGDRRSFALLRTIADPLALDRVRDIVLQAYLAQPQESDDDTTTQAQ